MASTGQLAVDLVGLEDFSATLQKIRDSMNTARSWMREFDDDLGGSEVRKALDHFEGHWRDGRGQIDKNCDNFIKLVKQAVENLRQTDTDLSNALETSSEVK